jgi:hypothetical protein
MLLPDSGLSSVPMAGMVIKFFHGHGFCMVRESKQYIFGPGEFGKG